MKPLLTRPCNECPWRRDHPAGWLGGYRPEDFTQQIQFDGPPLPCHKTIPGDGSELLETHIAKCNEGGDCEDDRPPHVISEIHRTNANIDSIASCDIETGTQVYLVLDDRTSFRITVEAIAA